MATGPSQVTKADLDNLDNLDNLENLDNLDNLDLSPPLVFFSPGCWLGPVATADLDNLENLAPDLENKIFKIGLGHRPRPGDQDRS